MSAPIAHFQPAGIPCLIALAKSKNTNQLKFTHSCFPSHHSNMCDAEIGQYDDAIGKAFDKDTEYSSTVSNITIALMRWIVGGWLGNISLGCIFIHNLSVHRVVVSLLRLPRVHCLPKNNATRKLCAPIFPETDAEIGRKR